MQMTVTDSRITNFMYSVMKTGLLPTAGGFQNCPAYMNNQMMSSTSLRMIMYRVNLMYRLSKWFSK